ncbi:hypothetical protein [Streptomyces iconiensis]|uniref:Small hydrophilic protein n=1 Tax=Streptomyces iconiensis TaxID=1384038 RepID=A0ABT7A2K9_9ACTN|nr:hypothetical protein [Streptomyces iconiensis]MDJ1135309.1 hypothetical protein [Streptomyces iconiensis]
MAKNKGKGKNRQQQRQQNRSAEEQTQEQVRNSGMEQTKAQGSPADVARKHQRRFGHN